MAEKALAYTIHQVVFLGEHQAIQLEFGGGTQTPLVQDLYGTVAANFELGQLNWL